MVRAYLTYEALICRGCGGFLPETTDEGNSYKAEYPHECRRCVAVQGMQDEYKEHKHSRALVTWPVHLKEKHNG